MAVWTDIHVLQNAYIISFAVFFLRTLVLLLYGYLASIL